MHSESKLIHEFALKLFQRLGNEINLSFEKRHKVIIDRFDAILIAIPFLTCFYSRGNRIFLLEPNSSFKANFLMLSHLCFNAQLEFTMKYLSLFSLRHCL